MPPPAATAPTAVPLCVDLDGTVIKTDLTWETLLRLARRNPLYLLAAPFWLLRGRAHLKARLAALATVDAASLPYCEAFLDFVRAEKRTGRPVLLVTASDQRMARPVAEHVGCFDEILASNGVRNLRGRNKAATLAERFKHGFDYAGNSCVDYPVWQAAREAIVVNASSRVSARAHQCARVSHVFDPASGFLASLLSVLRPHQWVKNFVLFVPLIAAHRVGELPLVAKVLLAFVSFSACASAVYVLNDLLDLEADRHHHRKRTRALASGRLPLWVGLLVAPALLLCSGGLASVVSPGFGLAVAGYFVVTTAYSLWIKTVPLLDVFCLAGLYTLRLIAGHEATGVAYSFWLLVFSMFIFLSLGWVKRFVELHAARERNHADVIGRGYAAGDLGLVVALGTASGFLAVLVMALYVHSAEVQILYRHPTLLLLSCPLLLYWLSRMWLVAHRGQMHDDPIVFAIKDPASYIIGLLMMAVLWLAAGH